MVGVYFSGTGNTKFCVEKFVMEYDQSAKAYSIEDRQVIKQIGISDEIVFGYPVQYSNIPKFVKDFINGHATLCPTKNISSNEGRMIADHHCTMCYRCVNHCPQCAITLLGKKVTKQTTIEKYL